MSTFIQINQASFNGDGGVGNTNQYIGNIWKAGSPSYNNGPDNGFTDTVSVQTFTGTAKLNSIDIIYREGSDLKMKIYEGPFTDSTPITNYTELTGGGVAMSDHTATYTQETIDFSSLNINLTAGTDYGWMVETSSTGTSFRIHVRNNTTTYPDGQRWRHITSTNDISLDSVEHSYTMRITMGESAGGGGDPLINPINEIQYYLPINENFYCLLDTLDPDDRLVINAKTQIWKSGKSYFRYIYIYYNGESFIMKLPQLWIVLPGTLEETMNHKLENDPINRHNTDNIVEIRRTSRIRKFLLTTTNYGTFHLIFYKNKNRFNMFGNLSRFNNGKTVGCFVGESSQMMISKLDYVSPL